MTAEDILFYLTNIFVALGVIMECVVLLKIAGVL